MELCLQHKMGFKMFFLALIQSTLSRRKIILEQREYYLPQIQHINFILKKRQI